jgi:hypothetical protein
MGGGWISTPSEIGKHHLPQKKSSIDRQAKPLYFGVKVPLSEEPKRQKLELLLSDYELFK